MQPLALYYFCRRLQNVVELDYAFGEDDRFDLVSKSMEKRVYASTKPCAVSDRLHWLTL